MPARRTFVVSALLFALSVLAIPCITGAATIGLYTDPYGSTCTFSGNAPGLVTAYVVVKPDANGVRGVRFSAPIPSCLGAVLVSEQPPDGALVIGTSEQGIAVAFPYCAGEPVYALEIKYMRASTTACCEFAISPDPYVGIIEGTDCNFNDFTLNSGVSRFNANASCPCNEAKPPYPPQSPFPPDFAVLIPMSTALSWSASPFDGDVVAYDLYFGTTPAPDFVATLVTPFYQLPQALQASTVYYWRVVVRDAEDFETSGPVWRFTTRAANYPPNQPSNPAPSDFATNVSAALPALSWSASDPDQDALMCDVYFGTSPAPPLVASNLTNATYPLSGLSYATQYYWKVVLRDPDGAETEGPVWTFTTRPANYPPNLPSNPSPANSAVNVATTVSLSWSASDLDGDPLTYDVYLGTTASPPLLASNITVKTYTASGLNFAGTYFWKIVVRDNHGNTTVGPVWSFTTRPTSYPPNQPTNPSPATTAVNIATTTTLTWLATDPDPGEVLTYDVYFGTAASPPLAAAGLTTKSYPLSGLSYFTKYYWKVVVHDDHGNQTSGPVWYFTTRAVNDPPNVPTAQYPVSGTINVPIGSDLQWQCTDPNGDPLSFEVYFGTTNPPPLVASNVTVKVYDVGAMAFLTAHYWKIVAKDPTGAATSSSVFSFTTMANQPPGAPTSPNPFNGATGVVYNKTLSWTCTDEFPSTLKFDVYFGTSSPPPLVASNVTTASYDPGALSLTTQYAWKIVARDALGLETSGALWTFYTASPPGPHTPSPADNGYGASPLTLGWTCDQPNGQPVTCDLYYGTTNPPPLYATGIGASVGGTGFRYNILGDLTTGTRYYWRVYAYDNVGSTLGNVWSFVGAAKGDVNRDGSITLADAACALQVAVGDVTCAGGASTLADVNCEPGVTPRDALCIHRRAIGETCLFCGESLTEGASPAAPVITRSAYWYDGNVLNIRLAVSGVGNLEAFSFNVRTPANAALTSATRLGATGGFTAFAMHAGSLLSGVGGYSLTPVDASSTVDFITLQFSIGGSLTGYIAVDNFVDDLAGAASVVIMSGSGKGGGGNLPVTFTLFDATARDGAVRIEWELQAEDAIDSYTLFRRGQGDATSLPIAQGEVTATKGSYLDRSVDAGKTYQYEMRVRAADGDEVLSPLATVEVPALGLSLGANHPNPFNPQTTIPYSVPVGGAPVRVRLIVYDASGRAVRVLVDEDQSGGARDVVWNGTDAGGKVVTSGVYFCVLQVGKERRTQKLVLLK